jgi:hypothetical protein
MDLEELSFFCSLPRNFILIFMKNYLIVLLGLMVGLTSCEDNEPAVINATNRKVKKVRYFDLMSPQMNSESYYEYNSEGLITKEEIYRDGLLRQTTLYNWTEDELNVTREFTNGQPQSSYTVICKRIIASDNVKFGSVGYVKSVTWPNGNQSKYYYRFSDNTLQSRSIVYSNQPIVYQEKYHFNWSDKNLNRSYPFEGCMMGDNCSDNSPNWNFSQIEGVWTKLDYLTNRFETRNFGMKYIPYGLEDASGLKQLGSLYLLSKITIYNSQDPNDVSAYTDYSYEFDNLGRIIKETQTTDLGWVTYKEYEYYN